MKDIIPFADLTPDQQQAWVDVWIHEKHRHLDDVAKIDGYLETAEKKYGITARTIWIDRWIEI